MTSLSLQLLETGITTIVQPGGRFPSDRPLKQTRLNLNRDFNRGRRDRLMGHPCRSNNGRYLDGWHSVPVKQKTIEGAPIGTGARVRAVRDGQLFTGVVAGEHGDDVFVPDPKKPGDRPLRFKRKEVALDDEQPNQRHPGAGKFNSVGGKPVGVTPAKSTLGPRI